MAKKKRPVLLIGSVLLGLLVLVPFTSFILVPVYHRVNFDTLDNIYVPVDPLPVNYTSTFVDGASKDFIIDGDIKTTEYITYIQEAPSIKHGIEEMYIKRRKPFIVRNAKEMRHITKDSLIAGLMHDPQAVLKSYVGDFDVWYPAQELLSRWHAGQDVLLIDAPLPGLVKIPQVLSQHNSFSAQTQSAGEAAASETSVQLSVRGHYTPFHADPPETGGGWVYSAEGDKHWIFLPPPYLPDVQRYFGYLERANLSSLIRFVKRRALGPVYVVHLRSGDFLCWPPGWPHKVHTSSRFAGLGSYIMLPTDKHDMELLQDDIKMARAQLQAPADPNESFGLWLYNYEDDEGHPVLTQAKRARKSLRDKQVVQAA